MSVFSGWNYVMLATVRLLLLEMKYDVGDDLGRAFATIKHDEDTNSK